MIGLKIQRQKKRLTQIELGGKIGLSKQSIFAYENDLREPTLETLKKLSLVLECTVDDLL